MKSKTLIRKFLRVSKYSILCIMSLFLISTIYDFIVTNHFSWDPILLFAIMGAIFYVIYRILKWLDL